MLFPIQTARRNEVIYTAGCYEEFDELLQDLLPLLAGVMIGIIVVEVK